MGFLKLDDENFRGLESTNDRSTSRPIFKKCFALKMAQ